MSSEQASIEYSAVPVSELVQQCDDLLPRVRDAATCAQRINELVGQRKEISRKLKTLGEASDDYAGLRRQEESLQEQVDELCGPFDATREVVLVFARQVRYSLRLMDLKPNLAPIRKELDRLLVPHLLRKRSFISLEQALEDLSVVRARLSRLAAELQHKVETRANVSTDQEPQRAKRPQPKGRGRRPISEDDQKKLAKVLSPYMADDRWMMPETLEKICGQLQRKKVTGPAGSSWSRKLEEDQSEGKRNVIGTIRYRLYGATNPAKNYFDN